MELLLKNTVCRGRRVLPVEMGFCGWDFAQMRDGGADPSLLPAITAIK